MRSAREIVDSRWAMTNVVRPVEHVAQSALDRALGGSVHRGGRVVEDEDPRIGQDRAGDRDPLALAARQGEAALADASVIAVGQARDEPVGLRRDGRALDLLAGGVGTGVGDVVVDRGAEQEGVVVDDGDGAAQAVHLHRAHVGAVDLDRAGADVVEAGQQRHQRRLARSHRTDERHHLAGGDVEVDVAQRRLRRALEGEPDAAQGHMAAAVGQRRGAGGGLDPGLAVEHLEDARARGGRALGGAEHVPEGAHGGDEHEQVGVERGERAQRERAVDHAAAAEQQDRGEAEVGQEAEQRVEERLDARGEHLLVKDALDGVAEALELALLLGERLDDAHAGDVLLGVGGELGDPLLGLLHRRARPVAVAVGDEDHERHRRQRDRGQVGLEDEHGHRGEQDRDHRLRDEHQPVAQEEADRLQVDRRARHELARLLAVEEPQLEPLELAVERVAQVDLDPQRHLAGDQTPVHAQHQPPEAGGGDRQRQHAPAHDGRGGRWR